MSCHPSPTFADLRNAADNSRSVCIVELNCMIATIGRVKRTACYIAGAARCASIRDRVLIEERRMGEWLNAIEGVFK